MEIPFPGLRNGGPHRWNPHNINTQVPGTFTVRLPMYQVFKEVPGTVAESRKVAKTVLDGLILQHQARRLASGE